MIHIRIARWSPVPAVSPVEGSPGVRAQLTPLSSGLYRVSCLWDTQWGVFSQAGFLLCCWEQGCMGAWWRVTSPWYTSCFTCGRCWYYNVENVRKSQFHIDWQCCIQGNKRSSSSLVALSCCCFVSPGNVSGDGAWGKEADHALLWEMVMGQENTENMILSRVPANVPCVSR